MGSGCKQRAGHSPARICRWYGGKRAALSLRFDDSNPTHIERAVPMLDEHGLIGTFMVNPGRKGYQQYRSVWEGPVIEQGHELGDHTMTHGGARTDEEAESQIGEVADLLHRLQPQRKLITFGPGGATLWMQRKPFEFFRAKYGLRQVNATAEGRYIMSCSEVYPSFTIDAFTRRLERAIAEGAWIRPHFHPVGEGHLYISPPTFRQLLEVVASHRDDVWQAAIGDLDQYETEREASRLWIRRIDAETLEVALTCGTDPGVYTHPLTLEVDLPAQTTAVTVTSATGETVPARINGTDGLRVARFDVPPADAEYTVRAQGIGDQIRAPEASEGTRRAGHPYLLFRSDGVAEVLAKTSDPVAKSMWEMILREADSFVEEAKSEDADDGPSSREIWSISHRINVLGVAYALTHEPAYAQTIIPVVEELAAADSWHGPDVEMLHTGHALRALGLAYDWLYDALSEDQRRRIREAIVRKGIEPVLEATDASEWWTHWYRCNWGAVIYGQAGLAALSILNEEPRAAEWVRLFQRKVWHYTEALGDDGGWGESGGYGAYAWSNAVLFADALRRATGTDLFDSPKLAKLPFWFINILDAGGEDFIPFSNCGRETSDMVDVLALLAREYRDGHVQTVAQQTMARRRWPAVFAFLAYDPSVEPAPISGLPLSKVFPDLSWAVLRSSWEDPEAIVFGLKGGQKDWDHNHHDTNSFVLHAYGRPLIVDLLYPKKVWGCQTEAHNTVMVSGKDQRGHVRVQGGRGRPEHRGVIADAVDSPWYTRLVGDASLAYEQDDVRSFVREVMYLRKTEASGSPDYFVLFDDVKATAPSRIDWMLHTYGDLGVTGDIITIVQDDAAVDVTMVAPEGFTAEVHEKSLEEAGAPEPFDGADAVRYVKVRPPEPVGRGYFLSVLAPRRASASRSVEVSPLRAPGMLGALITSGETRDVAVFALDEPEMTAEGVEAVGRSCLVRRSGDRVTAATLHNGQRISADGTLLFETDSTGHAVLTFSDSAVTARLDLYNSTRVRIHCPKAPAKVLVGGKERSFSYDPEDTCVQLDDIGHGDVEILFE